MVCQLFSSPGSGVVRDTRGTFRCGVALSQVGQFFFFIHWMFQSKEGLDGGMALDCAVQCMSWRGALYKAAILVAQPRKCTSYLVG